MAETISKARLGITPFDSDQLKRLRYGQTQGLPAESILIISETPTRITFQPLSDYLTKLSSIQEAWDRVVELNSSIPIDYFTLIWYKLRKSLVEVQSLYQKLQGDTGSYVSDRRIQELLRDYEHQLSRQLQREAEDLATQSRLNQALSSSRPVSISVPEYTQQIAVIPTETEISPEEVYNQLQLNILVPIAVFKGLINSDEFHFYKLYQGRGMEKTPPFQMKWISDAVVDDAITLQLYTGDLDNNLPQSRNPGDKNYTPAVYQWGKKEIRIEVPIRPSFSAEQANALLAPLFPGLQLAPYQLQDIEVQLKVRDLTVYESLFSDMVMNDSVLRQYLSLRETSLIAVTSRRPTYFFSRGDLQFRIENRISKINEPFQLPDKMELMKEKTNYVSIIITAKDQKILDDFLRLLPFILGYYQAHLEELLGLYRQYIPDYEPFNQFSDIAPAIETNIKVLQNLAPGVFDNLYSRSCQGEGRQPVILSDEQAREHRKKTFIYRGKTLNRSTIDFPLPELPGIPTQTYACLGDKDPFPGLVNNKVEGGKFPFLPCCFGSDPRNDPNYLAYYHGESVRSQAGSINVIRTGRMVRPGQRGILPQDIDSLLELVSPNDIWYRVGVEKSVNSVISCLNRMTGNMDLGDIDTRLQLAESVYSGLLKQELPSLSEDEIYDYLSNPEIRLETQLAYRALEVYYQINLVVFVVSDASPNGVLETYPGFQVNYRPYLNPERPTYLLIKHASADGSGQYEMIGRVDNRGNMDFKIPREMLPMINDGVMASNRVGGWQFSLEAKPNLFYQPEINLILNLGTIFTGLDSQYLDLNGKLRALILGDLLIVTPISRPLNLSLISLEDIKTSSLTPPSLTEIEKLLRTLRANEIPAGIYSFTTEDNLITGVWWVIDIPTVKTLFFCPCRKTRIPSAYRDVEKNIRPYPDLFSGNKSLQDEYQHLLRVKFLLLEIIRYAFLLYLLVEEELDIDVFMDKYLTVENNHRYEVDGVNRKLPEADTVRDWLKLVQAPTLVDNQRGMIILDSDETRKLMKGRLVVLFHQAPDVMPPNTIQGFFQTASDFINFPGEVIFNTYNEVRDWIMSLQTQDLVGKLHTVISPELITVMNPYVLRAGDRYLLIQNVLDGELGRALRVSQIWLKDLVNPGFYAEPVGERLDYSSYRVNDEGELSQPMGYSNRYYVLQYSNGKYASVLPLVGK